MSPHSKEITDLVGNIATLLVLVGFILIIAGAFQLLPGAWIP